MMILKFAGSTLVVEHTKSSFPQRPNSQVLNKANYLLAENKKSVGAPGIFTYLNTNI